VELFRRGSIWWAYFSVDGKRVRKSTKQTKKSAAAETAMLMLQAAKAGEPVKEMQLAPTLEDFAHAHFLPWVEASNRELKTKEGYRYGWLLLKSQPLANMRMDRIRTTHIEMASIPGSPSTHNCALRTLRRMFSIAVDLELISKRPKIHLRDENERTALVSPETEALVAAELDRSRRKGSLKLGIYIILDCGMRPKEIANMDIVDLDFTRGLIHIPNSKTKAGKRYVPMTVRVREKLLEWIGPRKTGWVLRSPRYPGRPIQRQALTAAWRRTCNKAGVSNDLNLYCARHTFGTDAMEATKNPFQVMRMLGHADLSTTRRYQHHDIAGVGELMDARNELRHNLRHSVQLAPLQDTLTH